MAGVGENERLATYLYWACSLTITTGFSPIAASSARACPPPPPRLLPEGVEPPASEAAPDTGRYAARARPQPAELGPAPLPGFLPRRCALRQVRRAHEVMALLSDPVVVKRILDHLKIPATPPPI